MTLRAEKYLIYYLTIFCQQISDTIINILYNKSVMKIISGGVQCTQFCFLLEEEVIFYGPNNNSKIEYFANQTRKEYTWTPLISYFCFFIIFRWSRTKTLAKHFVNYKKAITFMKFIH